MPPAMAARKRKPHSDAGKRATPGRHIEPRESFHLPQALLDALIRYVDQTRPETTKSAVIRLALEEFLTEAGFWPPPSPPSRGSAD
jgi:hypothetical protein